MAGRSTQTSGNAGWRAAAYKDGEFHSALKVRERRFEVEKDWAQLMSAVHPLAGNWEVRIEEVAK